MIDEKLVSDVMRLTVFFTLLQFILVCIRHNLISSIVQLTILALDDIGYEVDSLDVSFRRIVEYHQIRRIWANPSHHIAQLYFLLCQLLCVQLRAEHCWNCFELVVVFLVELDAQVRRCLVERHVIGVDGNCHRLILRAHLVPLTVRVVAEVVDNGPAREVWIHYLVP